MGGQEAEPNGVVQGLIKAALEEAAVLQPFKALHDDSVVVTQKTG